MTIKAKRLKESEQPGKTELFEVRNTRDIPVEERQSDGSLDQVMMEYRIEKGDVGYFAKEYRPDGIEKEGAKVIDITAIMLNSVKKCIRWHLYDIKDTLAGENTVVKLYNQWTFGLLYLKQSVLSELPDYTETSDLGVITRNYDKERMERLRDRYQKLCEDIECDKVEMTLSQRKRRTNIPKARAILTASQAILNGKFQAQGETDTYDIHVRILCDDDKLYHINMRV